MYQNLIVDDHNSAVVLTAPQAAHCARNGLIRLCPSGDDHWHPLHGMRAFGIMDIIAAQPHLLSCDFCPANLEPAWSYRTGEHIVPIDYHGRFGVSRLPRNACGECGHRIESSSMERFFEHLADLNMAWILEGRTDHPRSFIKRMEDAIAEHGFGYILADIMKEIRAIHTGFFEHKSARYPFDGGKGWEMARGG